MELPYEIKTALDEMAKNADTKSLIAAAASVSEKYRAGGAAGKRLITAETEALAYALSRMPATYGAVFTALKYALECCDFSSEAMQSMLDVGSGTGAALFAAAENIESISEMTALERENKMSSVGKKLCLAYGGIPENAKWLCGDITNIEKAEEITAKKFDLVTASYALNELSEKERERAVLRLWELTNGLLLLVEPGTPEGFRQLKNARRLLIENGGFIAAPCTGNGACPLGADDWCNFTVRVARSRLHKQLKSGDAPYEDEKFCYLAVARESCKPCSARVIRHPKIESGFVTLTLCKDGEIVNEKVTRKDGALFKAARKCGCGDKL